MPNGSSTRWTVNRCVRFRPRRVLPGRRCLGPRRQRGLATDDAGLAERCGIDVAVVPGDPLGFKITTQWDLRIARMLVS